MRKFVSSELIIKLAPLLIFVAGCFILPGQSLACPGCNALDTGAVGWGFNLSVIFMMAMPFVVTGSIAVGLVLANKRNENTPSSPEDEQ